MFDFSKKMVQLQLQRQGRTKMGILTQIEIDFDLEIVEDFVAHYAIMCESMEALIISLGNESYYKDSVNDLFRIFHNIKSAAGFVQLDPILKLASLAEEVLEEARELDGPGSDEFIDWLLMVSDQFAKYRLDLEDDKDNFCMLEPLIIKLPAHIEKQS